METPSDKLLELSRALYIITDDIFGRMMLLTDEELQRIDRVKIECSEIVEDSNDIRSIVQKMRQFIDKTIDAYRLIRHDEDCRSYLRELGSDAVWRFMQLGDLVESRISVLFTFFQSSARFQKRYEERIPIMETLKACIDYSEWLELLCEQAHSDSSYNDVEEVANNLKNQQYKLFRRLTRTIPRQGRPGRFVSFDDLIDEGLVTSNSDGDEAVLKAIKRLNDELVGTDFEAHTDSRRVQIERISPDK